MARNKRPRAISKKRSRESRVYARLKAQFMAEHPRCVVHPDRPSVDVHHTFGRAGANLLDVRTWLPVSREAHDYINAHPQKARARGLLCPAGCWNAAPSSPEAVAYLDRVARMLRAFKLPRPATSAHQEAFA